MSLRTWNSPYHLWTLRSSIIGLPGAGARSAVAVLVIDNSLLLAAAPLVEVALEMLAVFGHEEAEDPVDQADEEVRLPVEAAPVGVVERVGRRGQKVEQADDDDQRGILEGADEGVDQRRDHQGQRLRHDDEGCLARVAEAERVGRRELARGERL